MEYICIIQAVTFYIALVLNTYPVFLGDKGHNSQLHMCLS